MEKIKQSLSKDKVKLEQLKQSIKEKEKALRSKDHIKK